MLQLTVGFWLILRPALGVGREAECHMLAMTTRDHEGEIRPRDPVKIVGPLLATEQDGPEAERVDKRLDVGTRLIGGAVEEIEDISPVGPGDRHHLD